MTVYKRFFESSGGVKIEVADETIAGTSNAYSPDFLAALDAIAGSLITQMNQLPQDRKPDEFQVNFGLKALTQGGFAICLGEAAANFRIMLKWGGSREGQAETPGYPGAEETGL